MHPQDEFIQKVDAIEYGDPESAHGETETLLLKYLRATGQGAIADAFERTKERCRFWYA